MWPILIAVDLVTVVMRARRQAYAEAAAMVAEADRCLAYERAHGSAEQVQAAQELADAWRDYRDSL